MLGSPPFALYYLLYYRSSEATCVNDYRQNLFARKQRAFDAIPPTQVALRAHVRRAAYPAGSLWSQAITSQLRFHWEWDRCKDGWNILRALCHPLQPAARNRRSVNDKKSGVAGDAVSAVASVAQSNANACARSIWTLAFRLLIKTVCQSSQTSTNMCIFMNSMAFIF